MCPKNTALALRSFTINVRIFLTGASLVPKNSKIRSREWTRKIQEAKRKCQRKVKEMRKKCEGSGYMSVQLT